jgi:hypothetical protein
MILSSIILMSKSSSVGNITDCRMTIAVRFPTEAENFSSPPQQARLWVQPSLPSDGFRSSIHNGANFFGFSSWRTLKRSWPLMVLKDIKHWLQNSNNFRTLYNYIPKYFQISKIHGSNEYITVTNKHTYTLSEWEGIWYIYMRIILTPLVRNITESCDEWLALSLLFRNFYVSRTVCLVKSLLFNVRNVCQNILNFFRAHMQLEKLIRGAMN